MLDPGHLFSSYNKHLAKDIAIAEMTCYLNSVITGVFSTLTGGKKERIRQLSLINTHLKKNTEYSMYI